MDSERNDSTRGHKNAGKLIQKLVGYQQTSDHLH